MQKINKKYIQILKFGLGGMIGVFIGYLTLYFLTEHVGLFYVYSVIISHIVNQSFNFCFQKYVVFKNKEGSNISRQLAHYIIWISTTLLINTFMVYFLTHRCGFYYFISQIIMTTILSILNFFVTKKIFQNDPL
jgi:dolichol-phosphate mannosyltransferase